MSVIPVKNSTLAAQARDSHGSPYLSVSGDSPVRSGGILSPFFQLKRGPDTTEMIERRSVAFLPTGRDIPISLLMIKAFIQGYTNDSVNIQVQAFFKDSANTNTGGINASITTSVSDTSATLQAQVVDAINAYCDTNGVPRPDSFEWLMTAALARSFSNPSLAVNTARQASATRDAFVSASVDITASLSLTTGQRGTVTLQYADDSGFTTNVKTAQGSTNGNTGSLTIGLNLGQTVSAAVSGMIPAGKYYRLQTTQNTGSPTFGTPSVQEVLL